MTKTTMKQAVHRGFTQHHLPSKSNKEYIFKSTVFGRTSGAGFTLIELLIVIAILGILSVAVVTALNVVGSLNKGTLARAKTFNASIENALSINQVGKWSFEESSSPSKDTSGWGKDGTWSASGVTSKTASECGLGLGRCLEFDGANGFVTVPNLDKNILTVGIWVNRGRINAPNFTDRLLVSVNISGWAIYLDSDNTIAFGHVGHGAISSNSKIADTKIWHHIVVSYNGSQGCFYIDGVRDSCKPFSVTFNSAAGNYTIGSRAAAEYFKGLIDEVVVYNQALTSYQIQQLYSQGLIRHVLAYR